MEPPSRTREPLFRVPPVTLALCAALIAGYLVTEFVGWRHLSVNRLAFDPHAFLRQFDGAGLSGRLLFSLFGHAFVHADFGHLATNSLFLLAFATPVERVLGPRILLGLFCVAAATGALATALLVGQMPVLLVGASGAVHGISGAAALTLRRLGNDRARRTGSALLSFLVVVNLVLAVIDGTIPGLGFRIGWEAHLGGLAAGLVIASGHLRRVTSHNRPPGGSV